jgi:hypothetical protein
LLDSYNLIAKFDYFLIYERQILKSSEIPNQCH